MIDPDFFFRTPAWVLCVFVFLFLSIAVEIGFRLGARAAEHRDPEKSSAGIGTMEGAVFGLFGLLLALTFSFVMSRVDSRRQSAVREANAISTVDLRCDVLPDASRDALRAQLREYVDQRVALAQQRDAATVAAAERRMSELQASMWSIAVRHVRDDPDAGAYVHLLDSLNDAFDGQATFDAAVRGHLPPAVLGFLVLTAAVASTVAGYALGLVGRRHSVATAGFVLLTTLVAFMILDLDRPKRGLFRAPTRLLVQLQKSMNAVDAQDGARATAQRR